MYTVLVSGTELEYFGLGFAIAILICFVIYVVIRSFAAAVNREKKKVRMNANHVIRLDVNNLQNLSPILDEIHDNWFDLNQVKYNETRQEVLIYFGEQQEIYDKQLLIRSVNSMEVRDLAEIQVYPFNIIEVDVGKGVIQLIAAADLTITLSVNPTFEIVLTCLREKI